MLELLAPAGSPEGVVAAVQSGADAIYLGFGNFNARRNAKNFTESDFEKAAEYCRIRGVKLYVTLNTLASDRELPDIARQAQTAAKLGADAILVQDLGVLKAVRQAVPDMPVHASTQMSIHNLEGVKVAAAMGISRVVLARELDRSEIEYICRNSPIEIEVFAHGALCMCYSGQCYMSAVIGRRSGNRGLCAQPCRMPYSVPGARKSSYPLSLKDNCLVEYLRDLERIGVKCVKLEGRMKRPEYAAVVTDVYSRAIRSGKNPSEEDMKALREAFSRDGFTDGYYTGKTGEAMFGFRSEREKQPEALFAAAKRAYLKNEFQRVPVRFAAQIKADVPARLAAQDDLGNVALVDGPVPQPAFHKELTKVSLQTQLYKTGGTPFICEGVRSEIDRGITLPVSAINEMRRTALSDLVIKRSVLKPRREGEFIQGFRLLNREDPPVVTVSVTRLTQLSNKLLGLKPAVLYVPLEEFDARNKTLTPFIEDSDITVAVTMPRIIHDGEMPDVLKMLRAAKNAGISDVLTGNIGHIVTCRTEGFNVRGDFGLNVYNSQALRIFKDFGLASATLSFELMLEQIRHLSKPLDCELIVYGRLPLMITENCIVKSATGLCNCSNFGGIMDRNGFTFPVLKAFGCRNVVLNSQKLFLADRMGDYQNIGLWGARLSFTTENAAECAAITETYMQKGDYAPSGFTRGLYYRGVE